MNQNRVRLYKLVPQEELVKFEKILPRILFDLPKDSSDFTFIISPISGWMFYANDAELHKNISIQALPKNRSEVRVAAQKYLSSVDDRIMLEREKKTNLFNFELFPRYLYQPQIHPVLNPLTSLIDHWIVRFNVMLKGESGYRKDLVPVFGASLDLRIGNGGKVIGLSSKWRPIESTTLVDKLELSAEEIETGLSNQSHDHNNEVVEGDDESAFSLCYHEKGEHIYQNFYTPQYVNVVGHHLHYLPASKRSLVLDIVEIHFEDKVDLFAHVSGGSGRFRYEWSAWRIEDMETSFVELGQLEYSTLTSGVYMVALTVIDIAYNIIEQKSNQVYVRGTNFSFTEPDEEESPIV